MKHFPRGRRYIATERVRDEILAQGRRFDWIADQVDVSKSHLTRVLDGERPVDEFTARLVSAILGRDFLLLWKVSDDTKEDPSSTVLTKEAIAS